MKLKKVLILNNRLANTLKSLRSLTGGTKGSKHGRFSKKLLSHRLVIVSVAGSWLCIITTVFGECILVFYLNLQVPQYQGWFEKVQTCGQ